MNRARVDGLYLLLLGALIFLSFGGLMLALSPDRMLDFKLVYCSTKCLFEHCDPYRQSDVLRIFRAEGETQPADSDDHLIVATRNPYPPSEFALTLPLALLPIRAAQALWVTMIAGSFLLASFLMWDLAAASAPQLSGGLVCLSLAFGSSLIFFGNPGCIAVGLCMVGVWSILRERFVPGGILCLAASLMLKPQDAGLVWLFFLLAGGLYRKRALQTLAVATVLSLPALLWVIHLSPHWIGEIQSNLAAFTVHGGINDPGPSAPGGHGTLMITNLQSAIASFDDDPRIYNTASYMVCAPLLLVWGWVTLRTRPTLPNACFGLAAIAALSMLPIYHRLYDAKLILLTVPACALLCAEGGAMKWAALSINAAGITLVGDLPWGFCVALFHTKRLSSLLSGRSLTAALDVPVPVILLAVAAFYLWVYARRSSQAFSHLQGQAGAQVQP
jgi:hypothetical protein